MDPSRVASATKGSGRKTKAAKENVSIAKNYPWLETFDKEAKACLAVPEMTATHVLKLITLLESHVSPEVSKLKTRPNRATKFLTQIRKKISLVKMGGFMIESETEKELFPTYGLLLVHIVNISLASSKIERLGAEKVATELYYLLKIMFQWDSEYILDVALCSNLDEHANSKKKVGFQLFSFIVEDRRLYWGSQSSQMKYSAVCSLLAEACQQGQQLVDQYMPNESVDKQFLNFLSLQMDVEFNNKKVKNFRELIKFIKPIAIKSISRGRLVVVSKRDIDGRRDHSAGSSDSSSATVNIQSAATSYSNTQSEVPSSSGYDPMNTILGELGLGDNFFLDTVGESPNKSYYDEIIADDDDVLNQNDHVSSSTRPKISHSASELTKTHKIEKMEASDEEEDEKEDVIQTKRKRFTFSSVDSSPNSLNAEIPSPTDDKDMQEDNASSDSERDACEPDNVLKKKAEEDTEEDAADSDLEVLSIIESREGGDSGSLCSDGSHSRDEAEAESGEDVVPNYDVDSDVEESLADFNSSPADSVANTQESHKDEANSPKNCPNSENSDDNANPMSLEEDVDDDEPVKNSTVQSVESLDETSSNATEKLSDSPVKKSADEKRTVPSPSPSPQKRTRLGRKSCASDLKAAKSPSKKIETMVESTPTTRGRKKALGNNASTEPVAVRRSSRLKK